MNQSLPKEQTPSKTIIFVNQTLLFPNDLFFLMKRSFWGLTEADKYFSGQTKKKMGESMTEIHKSHRIKERKDPERNPMCYIHHSLIQLQGSEQLSSEGNSSSPFDGVSLMLFHMALQQMSRAPFYTHSPQKICKPSPPMFPNLGSMS